MKTKYEEKQIILRKLGGGEHHLAWTHVSGKSWVYQRPSPLIRFRDGLCCPVSFTCWAVAATAEKVQYEKKARKVAAKAAAKAAKAAAKAAAAAVTTAAVAAAEG